MTEASRSVRYQRTPEELAEEILMMSDPLRWPYLQLPIKRLREQDSRPELGVLLGDGPRVQLSSLYQLEKPHETLVYDSFEAVVDDGWVVD